MQAHYQGMSFDLGTAELSEYDADGFPQVQPRGFAGPASGNAPFELHSPFGFLSRPRDPDASGLGCQLLVAATGDDCHAFLSHDPRYIPLVPPLKKGGSCHYCATGAFGSFDGDSGSYTMYVPYAFSGKTPSKAMTFAVNVDTPGQESIALVHGDGMALMMNAADGSIALLGKGGKALFALNADGSTSMGSSAGFKFAGGVVAGNVVQAMPVALAPPLLAWMNAVTALLSTMAAQLSAPGPVVGTAGAYTAPLALLTTAQATAATTMPAKSLSGA